MSEFTLKDIRDYKVKVTHACADMVAGATVPGDFGTRDPSYRLGWIAAQKQLAAMLHKVADGTMTAQTIKQHYRGEE